MRILRYISFLLAISVILMSSAPASTSQKVVEELCSQEPLSSGLAGVMALTSDGDTLVCYNGGNCFVPASNMKLLTCGVALDILGPGYKFRTVLAYSGCISSGVLTGNVYIIGGGDPTIAAEGTDINLTFGEWKSFLDKAGIKRIDGAIIGDGDSFGKSRGNESWSVYDRSRSYGAAVSGLNFYSNSQKFRLYAPRKAGQEVEFSVEYPQTPWMEFRNNCFTCTEEQAEGVSFVNTGVASVAEFTGSCRAGRGDFELMASNCFPEMTCAYYFRNYLNENGIPVVDYLAGSSREVKLTVLGETCSESLSDIVRHTLWHSDNFYAEALLLAIGRKCGKGGLKSGLEAEKEWLKNHHIRIDGAVNIVDGSGLSRKNYASPAIFVDFMQTMTATAHHGSFVNSLPHPGEGTLERRMPGVSEEFRGRIAMKSGSMNGTLCFSGYIFPQDGRSDKTIIFSIMTNNVKGGYCVTGPVIDKIITALASEI